MAVKKSDLYSSIWASCDELRGGMDATQYKDYVLFMLFIKYVSDKYGDSDDFQPPIVIPKGASFKDMVALKGNPNIGERINVDVIQPLVDANPSALARTDFPNFNDPDKLGEGKDQVDKLDKLIGIFQNPALDFSKNRAEHDDILGDAYEYLMRHFATESGKSKGQFYTPSEVSRVIAKVVGISPANARANTTAYDPTCGSGSLLLKVAAEAGTRITLEGQEKDVTTAGLARMNMILHDFPTAKIEGGRSTLTQPRFLDGDQLRTYDYVVANPPFSDKAWSTGFETDKKDGTLQDPHNRFAFGVPPNKQGDFAYLLHILRSMKSTGKAACILPHGVLFRGNAEAVIRENLVKSGILKAIIGLPANLFYGTGIPACILVLDKENATARKGIFMIDASKGFTKDGPKNRLREQDIHKIVDTFTKGEAVPRYARMVPRDEIAHTKNAFNLNLPRYIDSADPEDLHDIDGHLRGGIPTRDIDDLAPFWAIMPSVRAALFEPANRAGYHQVRLEHGAVKTAILEHPEFTAFTTTATEIFDAWRSRTRPKLAAFNAGSLPKPLIADIAEDLLNAFRPAQLVGAYDIYQHLMTAWNDTMQDDLYLVADQGWHSAVQPREIVKIKGKDGKMSWPEKGDFKLGQRRFVSDVLPASLVVARYFAAEQAHIDDLDGKIASIEAELEEQFEEGTADEGLLREAVAGEDGKETITEKSARAAIKKLAGNGGYDEEVAACEAYLAKLKQLKSVKDARAEAQRKLDSLIAAKYPVLTEAEVQALVIDDKWMARLGGDVQGALALVSQRLTGRVRELAERYAKPLPQLQDDVAAQSAKVAGHLRAMGLVL